MKERRYALAAGLVGAFTASLCCAGPLILGLFGVISIPSAGALANGLFWHYWWAFVAVGVSIALGAVAWYLRPGRRCPTDEAVRLRRVRMNTFALAVAIFVAGYFVWDFVIVESIGIHVGAWTSPFHHVHHAQGGP